MNNKYFMSDISVLIIGFDGYKDVWDHDIELMNKYWPDRPKTYLANSELLPEYDGVEIINAGPDSEWSKKVQVALDRINTPYILLLLEDFFITDYVDNGQIQSIVKLIEEEEIKFYQILVQLVKQTWEKGQSYKGKKHIKIIPKDKKYGINLQAAIWEKNFLKETVGTGNYNAWEFEINQLGVDTYNIEKIEYLIDVRNVLHITHAVVQSKYLRNAKRKLSKIGITIPDSEREQLSRIDDFKYNLKLLMYSATPKVLIKPFKYIGRIFKVDFVTDRINKASK